MLADVLQFYNYDFYEYIYSLEEVKSDKCLDILFSIDYDEDKNIKVYLENIIPLDIVSFSESNGIPKLDVLFITLVKLNPKHVEVKVGDEGIKEVIKELGYKVGVENEVSTF